MCPENACFDWQKHPYQMRDLFNENQGKNLPAVIAAYAGQWVAWFPDGGGIRDAAPDMEALVRRIEESGDDPLFYFIEEVDSYSRTYVGGIWDEPIADCPPPEP
jgi:hypothetical protein